MSSYSYSVGSKIESALLARSRSKNLLKEAAAKFSALDKEIKDIFFAARKDANKIKLDAEKKISEMIKEKEALLNLDMQKRKETELTNMHKSCAVIAADSLKDVLKNLDKEDQEKILSGFCNDLSQSLH